MPPEQDVLEVLQSIEDRIHGANVDPELLEAVWPAILGQTTPAEAIARIRRLAEQRAKKSMQDKEEPHARQG